jgi:hypothetical protein
VTWRDPVNSSDFPDAPTSFPDQQDQSTGHVTEAHAVLEGMVKVLRTIHSGPVWPMSCWVKEEQRYCRKTLRTKLLAEAQQLATEGYVPLRTRLRTGEMTFSGIARELVAEHLEEQEGRVRPTGKHQGGVPRARLALIGSVLTRHFFGFFGDAVGASVFLLARSMSTSAKYIVAH